MKQDCCLFNNAWTEYRYVRDRTQPCCPASAENSSPNALTSLAMLGLFKKYVYTQSQLQFGIAGRLNLSPKLALLVGHIERLT